MSPSTTTIKPGSDLWFRRTQAAELAHLSARQFDDAVRPRLLREAVRGSGRELRFYGPAVTRVQMDRATESSAAPDADPLMSAGGGDGSPALERYRAARAGIEERRLAQLDLRLVDADELTVAMRLGLRAVRAAGEQLARKYGNEAAEIHNEAIDRFEVAFRQAIEEAGGESGEDEGDEP